MPYSPAAQAYTDSMIEAEVVPRTNTITDADVAMHKEKMLHVLVNTSIVFFSRSKALNDDMMIAGIELIADMVGIDRLDVWQNVSMPDGLYASQIYHWDRTTGGMTVQIPTTHLVAYSRFLPQLEAIFSNGEHFNYLASQLPDSSILKEFGISSVFGMPVVLNNANWGWVCFADCHQEHCFDAISIEMMISAAFMIVNTIKRIEMEHELAVRNEQISRVMFDVTPIGVIVFDDNLNFLDSNEYILSMLCTTKRYFLDHFYDFSPEFQPTGSLSRESIIGIMKQVLNGAKLTVEWVLRSFREEIIPCELTVTRALHDGKYCGIVFIYDLRHVKAIKEKLDSAIEQNFSDTLTGIRNRRFLNENLKKTLKSLARSGGMLSFLMIDIDFFKRFNDTYGHLEGDRCLKIVAQTLAETVTRTDDFVVRYGGEEFAVVLPNTNADGVRVIAEQLCENVRGKNIPHESSTVANCVTISIGGTTGKVDRTQSEDDYISQADRMLYKSKQEGRNRANLCLLEFMPLESEGGI